MATRKNNRNNTPRTPNTVAAVRRITNRLIACSTVNCGKITKADNRLYAATTALDKITNRYAEGDITANALIDALKKIRDTLNNIGSDLTNIECDLEEARNEAIFDLDDAAGKTSVL
jgi:septation ring formation regulator EzrA